MTSSVVNRITKFVLLKIRYSCLNNILSIQTIHSEYDISAWMSMPLPVTDIDED